MHDRQINDDPFGIFFQPIAIGPVVAPNRFYQVPHCNGFGHRMPRSLAAMREVKAEGGWGVVCTEEVEIHPTSDLSPYIEGRLWDDMHIPALQLMAESVHRHGALAGIELTHGGLNAANLYSRLVPFGARSMSVFSPDPVQCRRMDKEDIRSVRRWHRAAALRAKRAGFDIVYCYAAHGLSLAMQFLLRRYNDRADEYGGSLENRTRLLRELIDDTKDMAIRVLWLYGWRWTNCWAKMVLPARAKATILLPCWLKCLICGMSMSAPGATTLPRRASKKKAIKKNIRLS